MDKAVSAHVLDMKTKAALVALVHIHFIPCALPSFVSIMPLSTGFCALLFLSREKHFPSFVHHLESSPRKGIPPNPLEKSEVDLVTEISSECKKKKTERDLLIQNS